MHAYSRLTIQFPEKADKYKDIISVADEVLKVEHCSFGKAEEIEYDENYEVVWIEDLEKAAIQIAKAAKDIPLIMYGVIDASESSGEYMDFKFTYKDSKLVAEESGWYILQETELFDDDYDVFCDEFEQAEDITKKKFNEFVKQGVFYVLDSGDGEIVGKVPLDDIKELNLD